MPAPTTRSPGSRHPGPRPLSGPARPNAVDQDRLRRVTRLLRMLSLLRTERPYTLAGLAEACNCSTKTIQRDITYWEELDVHVQYDPSRRAYIVLGDMPFEVLDLGLAEATSLALAEASVASARGLEMGASITSAFDKIRALVAPEVADRLQDCRDALLFDGDAKRDYSHAPLMPLIAACRGHLRVIVDYDSHSSHRRVRPIEPYRIAFIEGFWFIVANDPERGEVRSFALDRILSCKFPRRDIPFRIPAGWTMAEYMAGSVGVLRGPKTDVVLRFEPEAVCWLSDRMFRFPHTLAAPAPDGSVTLCGTVAGLDEIAREVLRWGRNVTVLEPEPLRRRIATEAEAIAAKYRPR